MNTPQSNLPPVRGPIPPMPSVKAPANSRDERQYHAGRWITCNLGADNATNMRERGMRLLEEAVEAAQAAGVSDAEAVRIVGHVFSKAPGDLRQEIGGVGLTLLGLANAAGVSADEMEKLELSRVQAMDSQHIRDRHAKKVNAGVAMQETLTETTRERLARQAGTPHGPAFLHATTEAE